MRLAARVDDNQKDLVNGLRKQGFSVWITSALGHGAPDIVVGSEFGGLRGNYLFEIKDPDKPPSRRLLTHDEITFHNAWKGQIDIVHTLDDALAIIRNSRI